MDNRTAPAPAPPVLAGDRPRTRRDVTPRITRLCYVTGALLIGSGLLHVVVLAVDGGPWEGPVSWRKPITFGVSFGLTLLAVAWISSYLRMGARLRAVLLGVYLTRTGHQLAPDTPPPRPSNPCTG